MSTTIASIFTGGALWEIGALTAGLTPLWGIEIDPEIAAVAASNLPPCHRMLVGNALTFDPTSLKRPDILVASPPCQAHSVARSKSLAPRTDADAGACLIGFVRALLPRAVLVENVPPYADSPTFKAICDALMALGYWVQWGNVNSADFAVPQTRRRLILRAVRDGLLAPLPPPVPWRGWYDAIADLIPTLPESRFADWQLRRLGWLDETALVRAENTKQAWGKGYRAACEPSPTVATGASPRVFLVSGTSDAGVPDAREPAQTVNATLHEHGRPPTAFLVGQHNSSDATGAAVYGTSIRFGDELSLTIQRGMASRGRIFIAHSSADNPRFPVREAPDPVFAVTGTHGTPRAWLERGRVVKMTPRALARFQSFPDSYDVPEKAALATTIIGNAIPPLLSQRLLEATL